MTYYRFWDLFSYQFTDGFKENEMAYLWKDDQPIQVNPHYEGFVIPRDAKISLKKPTVGRCDVTTSTGKYSCIRLFFVFTKNWRSNKAIWWFFIYIFKRNYVYSILINIIAMQCKSVSYFHFSFGPWLDQFLFQFRWNWSSSCSSSREWVTLCPMFLPFLKMSTVLEFQNMSILA